MRLSKEEKKELLSLSNSSSLRRDFRQMKSKRKFLSLRQYVDFLSFCSKLYGRKAAFRKIEGRLFKL